MRRPVTARLNAQCGPWKLDADFAGEALHIRPRNDLRWHVLDAGCWCGPVVQEARTATGDEIPVWQHIAADGRE